MYGSWPERSDPLRDDSFARTFNGGDQDRPGEISIASGDVDRLAKNAQPSFRAVRFLVCRQITYRDVPVITKCSEAVREPGVHLRAYGFGYGALLHTGSLTHT